ncbi:hypothetical protein HDK77DRAFT_446597 [Phyllosticta capitalensis]
MFDFPSPFHVFFSLFSVSLSACTCRCAYFHLRRLSVHIHGMPGARLCLLYNRHLIRFARLLLCLPSSPTEKFLSTLSGRRMATHFPLAVSFHSTTSLKSSASPWIPGAATRAVEVFLFPLPFRSVLFLAPTCPSCASSSSAAPHPFVVVGFGSLAFQLTQNASATTFFARLGRVNAA